MKKQDVFVKHRCPLQQQSQNLKVLHFDPPAHRHAMSMKCEQPLDKITIPVW